MSVENLNKVKHSIPNDVRLIAVSKTKPIDAIQALYNEGHRVFGENKVQELCEKEEALAKDIEWHMIGHLQSNKVKYIAPFVSLIHAVDSLKLLIEINKQAAKNKRMINCLLQFRIAEEESKFGMSFEEVEELLQSRTFIEMQHVNILGLMGMASLTSDQEQIRDEFRNLSNYFEIIKSHYFKFNTDFKELSMGMSNDYVMAIEEGSTMVRVGSSIFGSR